MNKQTPIADEAQKIDIIEHINEEHMAELCAIMADYVEDADHARPLMEDIFVEGCSVSVIQNGRRELVFVPFQIKGDLEEKVLYLAYTAMVKQGKALGGNKKRYFEVLDKKYITKNMLRLVLKTGPGLPENKPAFAYLFAQKILPKAPLKNNHQQKYFSKISDVTNVFFLWLIKILSSKQRKKFLEKINKGLRYYTLRKVLKSDQAAQFADLVWLDVYLHGDSPGSVWIRNLQKGDVIFSNNEYAEHSEHLCQGRALLVADETALPALAAILEQWQNDLPPIVLIITAEAAEQDYLPDDQLPIGSVCRRFIGDQSTLEAEIIHYLREQDHIETAWGALENQTAKSIRLYLRNERGLSGKNNKVKAYWQKK